MDALEFIRLPADLLGVPSGCFSGCTSLKKIEWPQLLMCIDSYAFYGCQKLETEIPDTVMEIGCFAFAGCKSIKHVDLNGVHYIGPFAFRGCTAELLNIPERTRFAPPIN